MADAKLLTTVLLAANASQSLNSGAKATLYTVPAGRSAIVTHVVVRNISGNGSAGVLAFGQDAGATDWRTGVALTNLSAAGRSACITPQESATDTPRAQPQLAAGAQFGFKATTPVGVTADIDVFGYEIAL